MEIRICIGSSCHIKGSYNIVQTFQQMIEEYSLHNKVELKSAFCMKRCQKGVSVEIDGKLYSVDADEAIHFFKEKVLIELSEK